MAKRDYYEVLGVSKDATEDEIKRLTEKSPSNIIRTGILAIKRLRKI